MWQWKKDDVGEKALQRFMPYVLGHIFQVLHFSVPLFLKGMAWSYCDD